MWMTFLPPGHLPPRDAPVAEVPCRGLLLPDAPGHRNSIDLDDNPNGIQAGGLACYLRACLELHIWLSIANCNITLSVCLSVLQIGVQIESLFDALASRTTSMHRPKFTAPSFEAETPILLACLKGYPFHNTGRFSFKTGAILMSSKNFYLWISNKFPVVMIKFLL